MKRYTVIAKYRGINRTNKLVIWADDKEQAAKLAIKWWRINADMVDITVKEV